MGKIGNKMDLIKRLNTEDLNHFKLVYVLSPLYQKEKRLYKIS
jgi:hypothetical protein